MPNTMSLRGHTSRPKAVSARGRALRAIPAQSLVPARRFQQNVGRSVAAASGASTAPAPVDDKNVPEAHRGLHGFLYGEGGAEEHDAVGSYAVRKDEDEGGLVMPVSAYLESRDGDKPLGTYLVYDSEGRPQYVGYSRNMVLAIKGHLARVGPQRCASVRAMVFANKAMASRTNMERGVEAWVEELLGGVLPPGNADPAQRIEWEGGAAAASVEEEAAGGGGNGGRGVVGVGPSTLGTEHMSAAELAAYEEKRLKMRKAMGEKVALPPGVGADDAHGHSHSHDHEEEDSPEERRRKLMKAMDRGDWSAVVSQQTQEATGAGEGAAASSSSSSAAPHPPAMSSASGGSVDGSTSIDMEEPAPLRTIDSPFRAGGQGDAHVGSLSTVASVRSMDDMLRLTVRGVEACLDEVRPYLMADGGDVEVVDVQDGIVYLRLQGACSSCPSQTSTMKGGIERIIRATFGDQVRDILQLEATDPGANPQRVDAALNMLRGAIHNWGGAVEVVSVENHVAVLRYKGPPAIGKGVQGAIKEQFKELREVQLVPFEEEGAAAGDSKAGAQGKAGSA